MGKEEEGKVLSMGTPESRGAPKGGYACKPSNPLCQCRAPTPNSCSLLFLLFWGGKKDFSNAALSGLGITLMFFRKFIEAVISLMKFLQFLRASLEVTCRSWCFCDDLTVGNAIYFHKFTDISASTQVNPSPLSLSCTKNSIIARVCLFWNSQSSSSQFPQWGNQIVGGKSRKWGWNHIKYLL